MILWLHEFASNFTRLHVFQLEEEAFVIHTRILQSKLPLLTCNRNTRRSMFTTKISKIKKPTSTA